MRTLLAAVCCIAAVDSAGQSPPLQAQLWPCTGSAQQQWTLPALAGPLTLATAGSPTRVLDLQGQGHAQLVDQPTPPLPSQLWRLVGGALVHNATSACLAASLSAPGAPLGGAKCSQALPGWAYLPRSGGSGGALVYGQAGAGGALCLDARTTKSCADADLAACPTATRRGPLLTAWRTWSPAWAPLTMRCC